MILRALAAVGRWAGRSAGGLPGRCYRSRPGFPRRRSVRGLAEAAQTAGLWLVFNCSIESLHQPARGGGADFRSLSTSRELPEVLRVRSWNLRQRRSLVGTELQDQ